MAKISKKRAAAEAKVDADRLYELGDAMALVKEVNLTKFDASVDVHVRMGIDPRKADQALRGIFSSSGKALIRPGFDIFLVYSLLNTQNRDSCAE